jgi:hypothetical protein
LFTDLNIDPFIGLPLTAIAMFILGYAVQRGLLNYVVRAPMFNTLLITFGLEIVIKYLAQLVFSADFRTINPSYSGNGIVGVLFVALILAHIISARWGWKVRLRRCTTAPSITIGRRSTIRSGSGRSWRAVRSRAVAVRWRRRRNKRQACADAQVRPVERREAQRPDRKGRARPEVGLSFWAMEKETGLPGAGQRRRAMSHVRGTR